MEDAKHYRWWLVINRVQYLAIYFHHIVKIYIYTKEIKKLFFYIRILDALRSGLLLGSNQSFPKSSQDTNHLHW